ncbi:hypothetical protein [Magnetospirillum sp. XM-1]|uniref:hypothetical protein n=1 Tax=Magnetospirillum sp. XM-1 TaxID=1663591 RepID=UPI000AD6852C|nr:hypothetical protein [Magnetospirillum sp. XM-1]
MRAKDLHPHTYGAFVIYFHASGCVKKIDGPDTDPIITVGGKKIEDAVFQLTGDGDGKFQGVKFRGSAVIYLPLRDGFGPVCAKFINSEIVVQAGHLLGRLRQRNVEIKRVVMVDPISGRTAIGDFTVPTSTAY